MVALAGKAIIITGGTRGIGAGIARAFLAAGADVLVCARHEPADLPRAGDSVADFAVADVRDPDAATHVVMIAKKKYGGVDVVVSNAGGSPPAAAATASPRFHAKVIELNLVAPLHVAQAAYQALAPRGGCVIMVGSVSGTRPSPGTAAYGAAKAGLHHLVTSLAIEWAPSVRVNAVIPGMVATEAADDHYGAAPGQVAATIPMGRMATPEDVAAACLFLASPAAGYISGASIAVHGGGEPPAFLMYAAPK
jgi:NAD(P)-dependent dehydrogenase (short-subunit alcohol dehydrogenase family)